MHLVSHCTISSLPHSLHQHQPFEMAEKSSAYSSMRSTVSQEERRRREDRSLE